MARRTTPNVTYAAEQFTAQRYRRSNSAGVRYGFVSLLRRFAASVNDCQVGTLKPHHVEDFFYGVGGLHETCGRTTLAKYRGDLAAFLDYCHRHEWLPRSGAAMVAGIPDKTTRNNRDRTRMTAQELLRLMDASENPRDRCLVAFVANTGVRISEALELRIRDINLARGEVYVRLLKQGGSEETYYITSDLDPELRRWLTAYMEACGELKKEWRLFPAQNRAQFGTGGKDSKSVGFNPTAKLNNAGTILERLCPIAGIEMEHGDGWHTIRRSVARLFFDSASEQGHDAALRMTQALLKHKHSSTTEGYLGLDLEKRKVQEVMQGKPFLSTYAANNVVPLKRADTGD